MTIPDGGTVDEILDAIVSDVEETRESVGETGYRVHVKKRNPATGVDGWLAPRAFSTPNKEIVQMEILTPDAVWEITRTER